MGLQLDLSIVKVQTKFLSMGLCFVCIYVCVSMFIFHPAEADEEEYVRVTQETGGCKHIIRCVWNTVSVSEEKNEQTSIRDLVMLRATSLLSAWLLSRGGENLWKIISASCLSVRLHGHQTSVLFPHEKILGPAFDQSLSVFSEECLWHCLCPKRQKISNYNTCKEHSVSLCCEFEHWECVEGFTFVTVSNVQGRYSHCVSFTTLDCCGSHPSNLIKF